MYKRQLIRNVLMAQYDQNAAVVLSGPATDLARLLDMYGVKEWIARKVRLLCVADSGIQADAAAARKVFAEWPTPIVTAGREIGEALPFPGDSIDKDFAWSAERHPVVDAYRAYQPMPYDAPSWAMAAMLYACLLYTSLAACRSHAELARRNAHQPAAIQQCREAVGRGFLLRGEARQAERSGRARQKTPTR